MSDEVQLPCTSFFALFLMLIELQPQCCSKAATALFSFHLTAAAETADFAIRVLLLHPSKKLSHLRVVAQSLQRVELLGQSAIVKKGVNLLVAGGTDVDRGAGVLLAALGVLPRNEVMNGECREGAIAQLAVQAIRHLLKREPTPLFWLAASERFKGGHRYRSWGRAFSRKTCQRLTDQILRS